METEKRTKRKSDYGLEGVHRAYDVTEKRSTRKSHNYQESDDSEAEEKKIYSSKKRTSYDYRDRKANMTPRKPKTPRVNRFKVKDEIVECEDTIEPKTPDVNHFGVNVKKALVKAHGIKPKTLSPSSTVRMTAFESIKAEVVASTTSDESPETSSWLKTKTLKKDKKTQEAGEKMCYCCDLTETQCSSNRSTEAYLMTDEHFVRGTAHHVSETRHINDYEVVDGKLVLRPECSFLYQYNLRESERAKKLKESEVHE